MRLAGVLFIQEIFLGERQQPDDVRSQRSEPMHPSCTGRKVYGRRIFTANPLGVPTLFTTVRRSRQKAEMGLSLLKEKW